MAENWLADYDFDDTSSSESSCESIQETPKSRRKTNSSIKNYLNENITSKNYEKHGAISKNRSRDYVNYEPSTSKDYVYYEPSTSRNNGHSTSKNYVNYGASTSRNNSTSKLNDYVYYEPSTSRINEPGTSNTYVNSTSNNYVNYEASTSNINEPGTSNTYVNYDGASTSKDYVNYEPSTSKEYINYEPNTSKINKRGTSTKEYINYGASTSKEYINYGASTSKQNTKDYVIYEPSTSKINGTSTPNSYVNYGASTSKEYINYEPSTSNNSGTSKYYVNYEPSTSKTVQQENAYDLTQKSPKFYVERFVDLTSPSRKRKLAETMNGEVQNNLLDQEEPFHQFNIDKKTSKYYQEELYIDLTSSPAKKPKNIRDNFHEYARQDVENEPHIKTETLDDYHKYNLAAIAKYMSKTSSDVSKSKIYTKDGKVLNLEDPKSDVEIIKRLTNATNENVAELNIPRISPRTKHANGKNVKGKNKRIVKSSGQNKTKLRSTNTRNRDKITIQDLQTALRETTAVLGDETVNNTTNTNTNQRNPNEITMYDFKTALRQANIALDNDTSTNIQDKRFIIHAKDEYYKMQRTSLRQRQKYVKDLQLKNPIPFKYNPNKSRNMKKYANALLAEERIRNNFASRRSRYKKKMEAQAKSFMLDWNKEEYFRLVDEDRQLARLIKYLESVCSKFPGKKCDLLLLRKLYGYR